MFVFAGSLPGLDRWPLSCRRAGGSPLGGRHAVGARGCGARSTRWFGLTVTCRGRGLPFHSREDGAQRALLKAGSAQRRSQHLKPGSLAPGPTLPASTRTLLLLEKGDPPGQSSPSREPHAVTPVALYLVVSVFHSVLGEKRWHLFYCLFFCPFRRCVCAFAEGPGTRLALRCLLQLSEEAAGVTPGPPCPLASCEEQPTAALSRPCPPRSVRGLSDTLLAGCWAPR